MTTVKHKISEGSIPSITRSKKPDGTGGKPAVPGRKTRN